MLSKQLDDKVQERRAMRGLAAAARLQVRARTSLWSFWLGAFGR
jgi:hypothetical protein